MRFSNARILFIILIFLISSTSLFSENENKAIFKIDSISDHIELNKFWKYHPGDDSLWAVYDYDDCQWDTLQPKMILDEMPDSTFTGIGWFRLHVQIDSSLRHKTLALTIDQQGASEIYLNGQLIASPGSIDLLSKTEVTYNPKLLPFLVHFTDSIHYVIAVRYSHRRAYEMEKKFNQEFAGFKIKLSTYHEAQKKIKDMSAMRSFMIPFLSIFLVLAFIHLLLYLFYKRQQSNLYFSLFMFSVSSIWILILYKLPISCNPDVTTMVLHYLRLLVALSFPLLSFFIYSIFFKKSPITAWVSLGLIPIIILLILLEANWTRIFGSIINLVLLVDIIRNIIMAIVKKKKGAWIIASGFLFFIFFFILAISTVIVGREQLLTNPEGAFIYLLGMFFLIGIIGIPLSMSIYLARDFALTNKNLAKQLVNVKNLSAKTIEQEKEKQRILKNQKEKLEVMVAQRTEELEKEKEKTEELLLNTLPLKVVNELKENGKSEPESFDNVTVYFSDIVGFTNISSRLEPKALIDELNAMFTVFDDIMSKHDCERIKTIGDAYLAVSGMPIKNKDHAENMLIAAREIKQFLEERNRTSEVKWRVRIGIHTGKVVGGIVGVRKYIYDVFGDAINTASRMESNSEPMRINVSDTTYQLLKDKFKFIGREPIMVKGKGKMKMYFVED